MALVLTSGPAAEPITLAEAKAHMRVDGTAEDTLVSSLIITSRLHIEAALGLAFITQAWSYFLDAWPASREVRLPLRPVQSITAVRLYAADESIETVPADTYMLDGAANPARLVRNDTAAWPKPSRAANGIEIAFVAGYGNLAASVPAPIRQAILLLVAHWYEHREPVELGAPGVPVPPMVSELLLPYRSVRL
ncbi:MAG TPA: head-tail connector protein [Hyphomicrobiaceae bacterium]|nr:head-tail connector protein [Hyphomicrobiaceae bacterium]